MWDLQVAIDFMTLVWFCIANRRSVAIQKAARSVEGACMFCHISQDLEDDTSVPTVIRTATLEAGEGTGAENHLGLHQSGTSQETGIYLTDITSAG